MKEKKCETCSGCGRITIPTLLGSIAGPCPHCNGSGKIGGPNKCEICGGNTQIHCTTCDNTGLTEREFEARKIALENENTIKETCQKCFGQGVLQITTELGTIRGKCPHCNGKGVKIFPDSLN